MNKPIVGFAGMTHLGINSAVAAAERGYNVVCYDQDESRIAALCSGRIPVREPMLDDLFRRNVERLSFSSAAESLSSCDVVYVAPDVPTDDAGRSDLKEIDAIISRISASLQADAVLVILSQVPPGFTRALGRRKDRLYYQVETLIFGRAMERALHPERFIVGCVQPSDPLPRAYADLLRSFHCPVLQMGYESAELAKISINVCLVASVTVANTLAELCENIGADWSEIVPALKLDKRIGKDSYLSPGLGIAGGNLERDLATVIRLAEAHRTDAGLVSSFLTNSMHRRGWPREILERLLLRANPKAHIAVLGLTYKENTHSLKNSPSLALIATLQHAVITAYDPAAPADATSSHVSREETALAALDGADAVAVMTPWPEFRSLTADQLASKMRGRIVVDPYRVLDGEAFRAAGFAYATLGVAANVERVA